MIISHKYKFIFIKTEKTGGTSLEIALSKFCGDADVITPFGRDQNPYVTDEDLRKRADVRGAQNFRIPWTQLSLKDIARTGYRYQRPARFLEHEFARDIRLAVGENIFSNYWKFAVFRNPFDRAVSSYFWHLNIAKRMKPKSIFEFMLGNPAAINRNWAMCSDEGRKLIIDETLRYEDLGTDLIRLGERLGIPGNIHNEMRSFRAKSSIRPSAAKDYHQVIDERSRLLIELLCTDEIERMGYEF